MATDVLCNNFNCKNNDKNERCIAGQIGLVDNQCITRRRVKQGENYRNLMRRDDLPVKSRRDQVNSPKVTGMLK